ncbi:hypothetical protein ACFFLM_16495 [Deinococcus oregonensis]|uniref:Uncharacterized protein n=1 Tax=Deinococcus oregonensis TaxID=1805970 RepID=A0ABV6B1C9_9DEIO
MPFLHATLRGELLGELNLATIVPPVAWLAAGLVALVLGLGLGGGFIGLGPAELHSPCNVSSSFLAPP